MAESFKFALTCIQAIKDFDGSDPSQLPDFLNQIESLYIFVDACEEAYKPILFTYIKIKCIGQARHVIQNTDHCNSWIIFKDALRKHFGEKESTTVLMDQLKTLQLQGTIEKFYFKITQLVRRINNRRLTHDDTTFSSNEIKRSALNTFKNHLPEPTKTLIFARNPPDLEEAFKIILEARHENFTHYGSPSDTYRTNFIDKRNNSQNRHNNYRNTQNINNNNNSHHNPQNNHYNNNNNNNRNNNNYNNQRNNNHYNNNNNHNNQRNNNQYNNNNNYNNQRNNNNNQRNNNQYNSNYNNQNTNNYNRSNNSGNTRQSHNNSRQTHNTRQTQNTQNTQNTNTNNNNNNTPQPMDIGQHDVNFLTDASEDCLT